MDPQLGESKRHRRRKIRDRLDEIDGMPGRGRYQQAGNTSERCSEPMGPVPQTDGHDGPWLVDEFVPSLAAVVDDVGVGREDEV